MKRMIVFRVVAGLVLLAAVAGLGGLAFRAGMARGAALSAQAQLQEQAPAGAPVPGYGYGPGYGYVRHPGFGFGFGCLGALLPLFLLFLAFGALRRLIGGPRWGHRHGPWGHGPWGHGPQAAGGPGGVPPMFAEWHRQAHEQSAPEPKSE